MPKGYRKPADWDGFAMAVADAQHAEQLAAVKRDDPRIRIPQDAVWAEVKRERDQLFAEIERLEEENNTRAGLVARLTSKIERQHEELAEWEATNAAELRGIIESHMDMARSQWECVAEAERLRAALREVVSEGHRDACKISVGRCNCSYSDAAEAFKEQA